ncbi:hypothetical protein [Flavobacterium sp. CLA17]|uniref:hypothetical protein n=1 Tax=Flavobacterium sp. CLA17 TaxID=2724135 RepID=UPI0014924DBB|nr:hypothetical protein [Flavobacterium sp. CLA17]QSB29223.1 hypothetical protein HAV12_010945 [Flavobacterium sp. CLA17]
MIIQKIIKSPFRFVIILVLKPTKEYLQNLGILAKNGLKIHIDTTIHGAISQKPLMKQKEMEQ